MVSQHRAEASYYQAGSRRRSAGQAFTAMQSYTKPAGGAVTMARVLYSLDTSPRVVNYFELF